jgi:hypothetical protein
MKKTSKFDFAHEVYTMKVKKIDWVELLTTIMAIAFSLYMIYLVVDTAYMIIKYIYA